MNYADQLQKARSENEVGLKQKAVNRLKNLINTFPDETSARDVLAELYYEAGFLDMAGKYWYLSEPVDERMIQSVAAYNKSVGYSPLQAYLDINFRGNKALLSSYAAMRLTALEEEIKATGRKIPVTKSVKIEREVKPPKRLKIKFLNFLLNLVFGLIVLVFILGIVQVVRFISGLF